MGLVSINHALIADQLFIWPYRNDRYAGNLLLWIVCVSLRVCVNGTHGRKSICPVVGNDQVCGRIVFLVSPGRLVSRIGKHPRHSMGNASILFSFGWYHCIFQLSANSTIGGIRNLMNGQIRLPGQVDTLIYTRFIFQVRQYQHIPNGMVQLHRAADKPDGNAMQGYIG